MIPTRSQHPAAGPALSEVIDGRTGKVRVSGHLTPQGADLLRGTVEGLRRLGHSTVVLDLADVQAADDVGLHVLQNLRSRMAAAGDELLLRNAPAEVASSV
ncbi:STAS domain-containing protein [Modestobacter sp. DSM 44400]|uniref:STAS domain-containing protein n=1 Tax=Modestobacter sp. DSM 44400 TaxID=1550230 RepID=UPI000898B744|nr:STAS domain-containing protein [Modestobacter sp. DSM 44400]SDY67652.1 STAS domain-containing protein [Modestobacter sp. DSM 44400]